MSERIQGAVHDPRTHDSARRHVSGEALYIDDLPEPAGLLHIQLGLSAKAHAMIVKVDLGPVRVTFAVGTAVASRPPHRSVRAQFGHTAPTSSI